MGVKINVGYCQKIGLPNYGSEGAHCNLELEVDSSLLGDQESFQHHVQEIYTACRTVVETQLHRNEQVSGVFENTDSPTGRSPDHRHGVSKPSGPSPKQSKYAEQLAAQVKGFGVRRLDNLCERMYRKPFASISGLEASNLIDTLREAKAGRLDLSAV